MIHIYTANNRDARLDALKQNKIDLDLPENSKSPFEQLVWVENVLIKYFLNKDVNIFTYSPYILNYLNVFLADGTLNKDNLDVQEYVYLDEEDVHDVYPLIGEDDDGNLMVDTHDLSEPIEFIYNKYREIIDKK